MRLKKIAAAALALAMTVSMVSVPVFAAEGDNGEGVSQTTVNFKEKSNHTDQGGGAKDAGTASTDVKIIYSTDATQLSVTVPIAITFAVDGEKNLIAPTSYGITNESVIPVYVKEITVSGKDNGYNLIDTVTSTGAKNMQLTMVAGTDEIKLKTNSVTLTQAENQTIGTANQWNIPAKKGQDGTKLSITFKNGKVDAVDPDWATVTNKNGVELFRITYTIEAGAVK